jgi:RNA polymerase sigma-70 factor (ECF subfamily)
LARDAQAIRDELLVRRCQRGETAAFAELIRQWERRLFYFVRRLAPCEADAWDVLQKIWVRVLRDVRRLRDPGALRPWLYRLARNTAVSHFRLEKTYRERTEPDPAGDDARTDEGPLRLKNVEFVHHALNRLPVAFREVLTLHFLEDMPLEEIAAVVGIPPGTVKSRLHYAKRALRELMAAEEKSHE